MTRRYRQLSFYTRPLQVTTVLERENAVTNGGRGSSVVRDIITYLRREQPEMAERLWDVDRDKVRQYEKLYALALAVGFEV